MTINSNNTDPPAVKRALQIFELIASSNQSMGIKDISELLEIPYSSAYRIVRCLLNNSYLSEQPSESEQYHLGYKFISLAKKTDLYANLINSAYAEMRSLAKEVDQVIMLGILQDSGIMFIEQVLSPGKISITMGDVLMKVKPINNSAVGKILVSSMPKPEQEKFVDKAWKIMVKSTEKSITDKDKYLRELEIISKQKYAKDVGEFDTSVGCFAVPLLDYTGETVAAISTIGNINSYIADESSEILKHLTQSGKKISRKLGYKEDINDDL